MEAIVQAWFAWAGSPNELIIDAASELNSESFSQFTQRNNIKCATISTEAHWQNGRAERHGAILGNMLSKYEVERPIQTGHDLQIALAHCTQAKNSLSIRKGYPPEVLVLGKQTRLCGSVCSDNQLPAHALADAESCHGLLFRQNLARREAARRAFHSADNDAVLRRALLRRSRPARQWYQPGEWVMIWSNSQRNQGWKGPMKVIQQEGQNTVWVTQHGKLYRPAPEHVRPVTSIESTQIDPTSAVCPDQWKIDRPNEGESQIIRDPPSQDVIPETSNPPVTTVNLAPEPPNSPSHESSEMEPMGEPVVESQEPPPSVDASTVPLPEESSDELCVGLYCQDEVSQDMCLPHQVWTSEILITETDIRQWKEEISPMEMAFLATAAKRQKSEVRLRDLTEEDKQQFAKAKQTEINNWLSTQTVKRIFRHQIPEDQVMRCRWLLPWKPIDPVEAKGNADAKKAKARLVVLGYLDPQLEEIPRDSPTMSKASRMMVLQLIASKQWTLMSFDIKAAFLQGQPQSSRVLGLEPVPELATAMKLQEDEICQLVKGAYGLVDAPYLWYKTLQKELLSLGFRASPFDPCVFLLFDEEKGNPKGILGIHVDDGLCGGDEDFHRKLQQLESKYPFGAKKVGAFTFTGIDLQQHPDKSITMSQSKYIKGINPIPVPLDRRKDESSPITEEERQQLRGLIGSLQFASVHTRPDLASRLSNLQSQINSATVETLLQGNRTLHEGKRHDDISITIQSIDPKSIRFLAFSDASFASKKSPSSQSGSIILATHEMINRNVECPISPISWGSKKIQKVVTSTLAAETMSFSSSLDQLSWIRLYWHWLFCPNDDWKHPVESLQKIPSAIATAT